VAKDADDILEKADALLARGRAAMPAQQPSPPIDFPVLTEVFAEALPPAATTPPAALSDHALAELESELRLQLLQLMAPELERLVEARLHSRLEVAMAHSFARARTDLENEVRRAVRETLAEVIAEETARLQRTVP
jgi:hypothetical protein